MLRAPGALMMMAEIGGGDGGGQRLETRRPARRSESSPRKAAAGTTLALSAVVAIMHVWAVSKVGLLHRLQSVAEILNLRMRHWQHWLDVCCPLDSEEEIRWFRLMCEFVATVTSNQTALESKQSWSALQVLVVQDPR